jgi:hypothetical protein
MTEPATRTRGSLLQPIIAGAVVVLVLALIGAFRDQLLDAIHSSSEKSSGGLKNWIPDHKGETVIIGITFLIFLGIDYVAHLVGRLRAWLFVVVVQIGVWFLFWNDFGNLGSGRDIVGLDARHLSGVAQINALLIVMVLSGVIFWILEAREEFAKRRPASGSAA